MSNNSKKFTQQVLDRIYTYHTPSQEASQIMQTIREKSKELAQYIVDNCPEQAETTTALNRLQEASFYANAAISRYPKTEAEKNV